MKPSITLTAFIFIIATFAFIPPKHSLPGKWANPEGASVGEYLEFKNDGTYNVYLPGGQIGEKGNYKLNYSTFSIKNAVASACGDGYWGKYKLDFYGDDSIHFTLIKDTCENRRNDMVGVNPGLRRMKTK